MSRLNLKDLTFADACGVNGNKKDVIRMLGEDYSSSVDNFLTFEQYFFAKNIPDEKLVRCWWRNAAWWIVENKEILTCGDVLVNKELKDWYLKKNWISDGVVLPIHNEDGDEEPSGCPHCDEENLRYKEQPNYIEILSQNADEEYKKGKLSSGKRERDFSDEENKKLSSGKGDSYSEKKLFKNIEIKF